MDEQGRFLTTEKEVVKVLLDPPPIPEIISPPPLPTDTANQPLPPPPESHPNPSEDSAWAALAGAAIILNPLLEDLAATHLAGKSRGEKPKASLKQPDPGKNRDKGNAPPD